MRKLLLSLMFSMITLFLYAEKVDQTTARIIAERFLQAKSQLKSQDDLILVYTRTIIDSTNLKSLATDNAFYIFSNGNKGFVIVSAEDLLAPIIGYSTQNPFNPQDIPLGLEDLFKDYVDQIRYCRTNNLRQTSDIKEKWQNFLLKSSTIDPPIEYGPILKDEHGNLIQWHQVYPYNEMCPEYNGQHAVVGCVNTAQAQIMRYWGHPISGTGSDTIRFNGQNYFVDFSQQTYNWDLMPAKYDGNWTQEQINEVAKICYHVGVSNHSLYGLNGTGAFAWNMTQNFDYNDRREPLSKEDFNDSIWYEIIKYEIINNRPTTYWGFPEELGDGHEFVCDGFNSEGYLHYNFGWGGNSDGFYNTFTPLGFVSSAGATINILPNGVTFTEVATNVQDSLALVSFYNLTDGSNWVSNSNWLTTNVSEWEGILTVNGRVLRIYLPDNNFNGDLPKELSDLSSLTYLGLPGIWENRSKLTGQIPIEFGKLKNLTVLLLAGNNLSGPIPEELGNLRNLRYLHLSWNQLSGTIPDNLKNLDKLTHLTLEDNSISGQIPSFIGSFDKLRYLNLSGNQLTGSIPSELGELTNLELINLSSNQLTGSIPSELGNLHKVWWFELAQNQLTGSIPKELGNLNKCQRLYLEYNQLSGSIPKELGNMSALWDLRLIYNELTGGIPAELGNLKKLSILLLYKNKLSGPFPKEICYLPELSTLRLCNNNLSGSIPKEIVNLSRLFILDLEQNQFSGNIPDELGDLPRLNRLYLFNNKFTGEIPKNLGKSEGIQTIALSGNQLTGHIPNEIGEWSSIENLYLNDNLFTDSIPDEINKLANLKILTLQNNRFSHLPNVSSLFNLEYFDIRSNEFTHLPDVSSLLNLDYFDIRLNKFTFKDISDCGLLHNSIANFKYDTQLKLSAPEKIQDTNVPWNYTLRMTEDHENNVYHWYKNGNEISGANNRQYTIPDFSGGTYLCKITNSLYPALTLESEPIIIPSTVGIDENSISKNLNIYPNPTNDQLTIEITDCVTERYNFEIYDIYGKFLKKFEESLVSGNYRKIIDCSQFTNGTYFLKIASKKGNYTHKFTIIH